jgi:hypothetical protein
MTHWAWRPIFMAVCGHLVHLRCGGRQAFSLSLSFFLHKNVFDTEAHLHWTLVDIWLSCVAGGKTNPKVPQ